MPNLNEAIDFDKAIIEAKNKNEVNLFFQIDIPPLGHSMSKFKNRSFRWAGGRLDGRRNKIAQSNGFTFAGLGKTTLRRRNSGDCGELLGD